MVSRERQAIHRHHLGGKGGRIRTGSVAYRSESLRKVLRSTICFGLLVDFETG
jgi:hypothetical protein